MVLRAANASLALFDPLSEATYDLGELTSCAHTYGELVDACKFVPATPGADSHLLTGLRDLAASLPSYFTLLLLLTSGIGNLCLNDADRALLFAFQEQIVGTTVAEAYAEFDLGLADQALDSATCRIARQGLEHLTIAIRVQGDLVESVPEQHDLWHEHSARAFVSVLQALDAYEASRGRQ